MQLTTALIPLERSLLVSETYQVFRCASAQQVVFLLFAPDKLLLGYFGHVAFTVNHLVNGGINCKVSPNLYLPCSLKSNPI